MKLQVVNKAPRCRILWTDGTQSIIAKGMSFFRVDENFRRITRTFSVGGFLDREMSRLRVCRQFTRSGIHHLWPLPQGGYLVVIRKRAIRVSEDGTTQEVFRFPRGNKPAHKGVCVTPAGHIFMGEYALNGDRTLPVHIHRSTDNGDSFTSVMEFEPGHIRHVHFVQWDPYEKCLWMGTGDRDSECWLYKSTDNGETWNKIGGGSQLWRAVGLSFRPEALYWGTDAGSDAGEHPNYVMKLDRQSLQLQQALEVQGPCHGNAALQDGTLLVSTGVEGGVNEKDNYAHLWVSPDGEKWQEVVKFAKDRWPLIIQYGVIRFPQGLENSSRAAFTCMGLAGVGETTFVASIAADE